MNVIVSVCVCACIHVCMHACMCVCVCERERERERETALFDFSREAGELSFQVILRMCVCVGVCM